MKRLQRILITLFFVSTVAFILSGCPRNQTTLDDRPLEKRPHVETTEPVDRSDPFRP